MAFALRRASSRRSAEASHAEAAKFARILARLRAELVTQAAVARVGIEHHSFKPYRQFRKKLAEHAALQAVARERLGPKSPPELVQRLTEEEVRAVEVSIQATLNFLFALSAIPQLPFGARETFLDELRALALAQERLTRPNLGVELASGVLDDIENARLILEEISERAPKLVEWDEPEVPEVDVA
jgi:hypothetical protein